ncbi:MAG: MlaD family protein [Planctomycetota bacterium]
MKKQDPRVRVGTVVTVFVALLFCLVFSLDSASTWWRGSAKLRVVFANVQGIRKSDPVHVHGVPCGRVAAVEFEDGQALQQSGVAFADSDAAVSGCRVVLSLELPQEIYALLRAGARATIDKTLTGVTVVNLEQGEGDPLPHAATIAGTERASIQEITDELHRASQLVSQVLLTVDKVVARCYDDDLIGTTLSSLRDVAQEGQRVVRSFDDVIKENRGNVEESTRGASELLAQLNEVSAELPALVTHLERISSEASDWIVGTRPRLDAITEDVAASTTDLRALASDLRHRPWRALHAPTADEAKALELYESATHYSQGTVELRRSIDRLTQLLTWIDEDPDIYPAVRETLQTLQTRLQRHKAFEESLWERLEGLAP